MQILHHMQHFVNLQMYSYGMSHSFSNFKKCLIIKAIVIISTFAFSVSP